MTVLLLALFPELPYPDGLGKGVSARIVVPANSILLRDSSPASLRIAGRPRAIAGKIVGKWLQLIFVILLYAFCMPWPVVYVSVIARSHEVVDWHGGRNAINSAELCRLLTTQAHKKALVSVSALPILLLPPPFDTSSSKTNLFHFIFNFFYDNIMRFISTATIFALFSLATVQAYNNDRVAVRSYDDGEQIATRAFPRASLLRRGDPAGRCMHSGLCVFDGSTVAPCASKDCKSKPSPGGIRCWCDIINESQGSAPLDKSYRLQFQPLALNQPPTSATGACNRLRCSGTRPVYPSCHGYFAFSGGYASSAFSASSTFAKVAEPITTSAPNKQDAIDCSSRCADVSESGGSSAKGREDWILDM
ncbi:hypothetical protein C8J56DRAFT_1036277 [Mycena floridula]|nr:hypothetical protein C8J56DRAFT_1036277 [Mycena floridula]